MRILGVDYGTKKIGLALSDESARFAFPHSVVPNLSTSDVHKLISRLCEENNVSKIVLGRPVGYKGDASKIFQKIEEFKINLEKELKLPMIYENEVLTTQEAKRIQGKNDKTDASAAAIILQSYLDKELNMLK